MEMALPRHSVTSDDTITIDILPKNCASCIGPFVSFALMSSVVAALAVIAVGLWRLEYLVACTYHKSAGVNVSWYTQQDYDSCPM